MQFCFRREKSGGELPVFTMMGDSNDVSYADSAPPFFDDPAISSTSSLSNADTSSLHVSTYNDAPQISTFQDTPMHHDSTFNNGTMQHGSMFNTLSMQQFNQGPTSTQSSFSNSTLPSTSTSQVVDQSLLNSQLDEVTRSKQELEKQLLVQSASKEELEKQLLVQAASSKQYDVYCQSLVRRIFKRAVHK